MTKLNITVTVDEDQLLALFTKAFAPFRNQPRSAPAKAHPPSTEPSAIAETKSAVLVREYFASLKPGRRVRVARVGSFLKKNGYTPSTAMPVCSALARAGFIRRVSKGIYVI